jgi:hypothetical protein
MKIAFAIITLFISTLNVVAQNDISAQFPGGDAAYDAYLQQNLVFPEQAIEAHSNREIRVVVQIDTFGKVRIQKYVFANSGLGFEKEVETFVRQMPNWNPAIHNGVVATSQMVLNFQFTYVDPELDYKTDQYKYYIDCEVPPTFVGGLDSIKSFITEMLVDTFNFKFDTTEVTIQFVVGADSTVIDAEVIESDNLIPDDYWIYVFRSLPNSIPGRIKNKRVNVQSTLSLVLAVESEVDN